MNDNLVRGTFDPSVAPSKRIFDTSRCVRYNSKRLVKTGKLFIIVIIGSYTGVLRSARVPIYGSTGIGDVTPLAHLILSLFGDEMKPVKGETLPLIAQSSITTALSAFALHDLKILLDEFTALASLDVEHLLQIHLRIIQCWQNSVVFPAIKMQLIKSIMKCI